MSELKLHIDALTGKVAELELSKDELVTLQADNAALENSQKIEADKLLSRTSALAKLAALGLTEEEIAAL
jgi:DNA-binding NarL/FixJ family response regulator